ADQVGELPPVVAFRTIKELLGTRTALRFEVGIAAVPLEWRRFADVFQQAVVHDVLSEAVGLEVPLQAVEGRLQVAVRAAEMALEGESRAEEEALAAALGRGRGGSLERERGAHSLLRGIDHGDGVVRPIRHVQSLS